MSELLIRVAANAHVIEHLREGVLGHILYGEPTGDFLRAVFANDLASAATRADPSSLAALPSLMRFLLNDAPGACWGSPTIANHWRGGGGLLGKVEQQA